ncbi:MAG: hypothetical protein AAF938_09375 [Myxococcota bacterium]
MVRSTLVWCAFVAFVGCGSTDGEDATSDADRRAVQSALLSFDRRAEPVLSRVDALVRDDRHGAAAEVLDQATLRALQSAIGEVEAVEVAGADGRALRSRAMSLLVERLDAADAYRGVLSRGRVEDLAFVDASRRYREAEGAYEAFLESLEMPTEDEEGEGEL